MGHYFLDMKTLQERPGNFWIKQDHSKAWPSLLIYCWIYTSPESDKKRIWFIICSDCCRSHHFLGHYEPNSRLGIFSSLAHSIVSGSDDTASPTGPTIPQALWERYHKPCGDDTKSPVGTIPQALWWRYRMPYAKCTSCCILNMTCSQIIDCAIYIIQILLCHVNILSPPCVGQ